MLDAEIRANTVFHKKVVLTFKQSVLQLSWGGGGVGGWVGGGEGGGRRLALLPFNWFLYYGTNFSSSFLYIGDAFVPSLTVY